MNYSNAIEHLYQEELYKLGPKVLVIIPLPWDTLSEADQLLLSKILASVKRTLASVQVLTLSEVETDDLLFYNASKIIVFGSSLKVSGKSILPYQSFRHDQASVLWADSLDQLDETKKKNLWNALKDMFHV
ncbi:MAG TPA: hypothetical protein VK589_31370 [Chryseolinea sp.]|nr:hypothetical protein [Chryseolinea sp.]